MGKDTMGPAKPEYKILIFNDTHGIENCIKVVCRDDGEAIQLMRQFVDLRRMELWDRGRLVEQLPRRAIDT
jgi:hypothetical protein